MNLTINTLKTKYGYLSYAFSSQGVVATSFMHKSISDSISSIQTKLNSKSFLAKLDTKKIDIYFTNYFDNQIYTDSIPKLDQRLITDFQKKVYKEVLKIRAGEVKTYKEIAIAINKPNAARAIGMAMRKNPFAPIVPCHRVISSSGKLTGYSAKGGINLKKILLSNEGITIDT
jgi:methylated-DNA-[protein]-cysteine S-methyltransferase